MQIRWSLAAADDLERICQRVEQDNPEAARRIARTIYDTCSRLRDFPNLGRARANMPGRRGLPFSSLPYIVVYQVRAEVVEISRIFHGAQDWP
jgi:toxin ParE1/3/4